jgi:lysophospholipase
LEASATGLGLPKSNQRRRAAISQAQEAGISVTDRRSIPPCATEGRWRAPDGAAIRRIDYAPAPGPARGSILFLPGRGDAYEKYLETLGQWREAGWRVTAADWRGQAGSGRLGADAVTGHVGDFTDWLDDLAALWAAWKAQTPGPHILAGHSMGGHLILRALAERRVDPDAVALSAPMLGFIGPLPLGVMHSVARLMRRFGDPRRPAWKWSEKPGEVPAARIHLLTHDAERYADELWWREHRPELVMGPGSWGWVERAYASMRALFAPGVLEAVDTPVLIIATRNDKLVDIGAIERAAARLPRAELVLFGKEAHHEILREVDPVRDRAMAAIAEFLDRVAPARA